MSNVNDQQAKINLIVDTNLLIEFTNIEDCPWPDIGEYSEIILILTEPVQTEIDELKKSNKPRVRRRAIKWSKLIRDAVVDNKTEVVFIESGPRLSVVLDFSGPDQELASTLDYGVTDDVIVGVAATLAANNDAEIFAVFSNDTRPIRRSNIAGVRSIVIPDDWRRPQEQSEEAKKVADLERQLRKLSEVEPKIELTLKPPTDGKALLNGERVGCFFLLISH